jgi:hypothetical protein
MSYLHTFNRILTVRIHSGDMFDGTFLFFPGLSRSILLHRLKCHRLNLILRIILYRSKLDMSSPERGGNGS